MSEQLDAAVDAVTTALVTLRAEPRSTAVRAALDRASAAVDALAPDLTAEVLHRLVVSIEDCHRDGVAHSPRLAVCRRSTSVALRLDPRWTRPDRAPAAATGRPVPEPTRPRAVRSVRGGQERDVPGVAGTGASRVADQTARGEFG